MSAQVPPDMPELDPDWPVSPPAGAAGHGEPTPVMAQYLALKQANPESLLFYRMGDFYELFFDDAAIAARVLGIALTRRGKHLGEDIPMCGVPVHAADHYLQKLIRANLKVAVCEQMEDPAAARKRGARAVVAREVIRLVTPGTLTEETLLDAEARNYLASLIRLRGTGEMALAVADISSGDLAVGKTSLAGLAADLAALAPREILVMDALLDDGEVGRILKEAAAPLSPLPASRFDSAAGETRLKTHFGVAALEAFGDFTRAEISALGGLLDYLQVTQAGRIPHLRFPQRRQVGGGLVMDAATRANLELTRTLSGERQGSLLAVMTRTVAAAGARLLAAFLTHPLGEPEAIHHRLNAIDHFLHDETRHHALRKALSGLPDLERALARLTGQRGGPRDLAAMAGSLAVARELTGLLRRDLGLGLPQRLAALAETLAAAPHGLADRLQAALADELPLLARDGGFIRQGFDAALDENRALRDDTRQVIAALQARYAGETGLRTLRIKHNNILGYFIEVAPQHAALLQTPEHAARFIHRQSIASAIRFTTTELADLEQKIAMAQARALAIEHELFQRFVAAVVAERDSLSALGLALAELDVLAGLATLARERRYVRPVVDHSTRFDIRAGRHPVVEAVLEREGAARFTANDCTLDGADKRLWLVTGPNMAGKSTFLRQNALIALMAQMGSFVPAEAAHIGLVDRLFSRVGAADDLARGRSTFMVEMVETATILNLATDRSLVILDEIGRGTATYDGLSIAWAAVEHLHEVNRARALFATHYHELTALAERLSHLANVTVKVREWQGEVIFLHEVTPGVADRSYGIQVAKLAGLPPAVIARAAQVLDQLEAARDASGQRAAIDALPLFSAQAPPAPRTDALRARLAGLAADELTPRAALALVYELVAALKEEGA